MLQAGRWRAEQTGNLSRLALYHWAIAEARLAAGHWDDAVAEAQAGLGLIEETANLVGDVFANAVCAHVAFHRGEPALAQAAVHEAQRRLVSGPHEIGFEWMSWIGALLLEAQGQPARALSILEQAWDLIAPLRYLQAASRAMAPDLVRMALASGDQQRALSVTDELERSARRSPTPTARGLALRCRGLVDDDPEVLLEAVAAHRDGPRPYPLAAACEDTGIALGRTGRADEAVPLLNEAIAIYDRLGAVRDVARVHSALRTLGIPRVAPRPPPLVRMGQPHPHRAAGRRPRGRGAHQPRDRRADVRLTAHRRHPPRARVPKAGPRQPSRTRHRRGTPSHSDTRRQQLRQHPKQPKPAHEGHLPSPRRD